MLAEVGGQRAVVNNIGQEPGGMVGLQQFGEIAVEGAAKVRRDDRGGAGRDPCRQFEHGINTLIQPRILGADETQVAENAGGGGGEIIAADRAES